MNPRNFRTALLPALLLSSITRLACEDAAAQESCASAQCHGALLKAKTVHAATESCDTCHESVATPHPDKGKKTFKLTQEPPALCFACHDEFGKKNAVHSPVAEGMCTTCHDPHASEQAKLLTQPVKELCESCHADHVDFKVLHGPVSTGDCTVCHTPHVSDFKGLVLKEGAALCFDCHADLSDVMKKKHVHTAVEAGCTSCHNPHGSAQPNMLAEEGQALCFQCHEDVAEAVQKAPVPHAALAAEKGCASCHSPHAADNAKLLLQPEKETCLGCHADVVNKSMTLLHGPIEEGRCTACHAPHGGQHPKLLVKGFPAEDYVPYTDTKFELCFGCHKRELLEHPDTSFATGFRDGDKNLHHLHVNNAQKGRSCKMCHSAHGSAGPKLIAESVPFGKWSLPLKYVKTETGGGCSPGCHKSQNYDRKSPGKKPEAQKPADKAN